jgi:hypothetical protein
MTEQLDDDALDLLLDSVEPEGDVVLRLAGHDLTDIGEVPQQWRNVLQGREKPQAFMDHFWAPIKQLLPLTVKLLIKKTSAIGVVATAARPLSLLYLFGLDKELYANRGFLPDNAFSARATQYALPPELKRFYEIHNGWVDFFSLDGGLLPVADWRLSTAPDAPYLEIYRNGSDSFGFDVSSKPPVPVALQPNEDIVERVPDLWAWLDQAYASALEDLDDAPSD